MKAPIIFAAILAFSACRPDAKSVASKQIVAYYDSLGYKVDSLQIFSVTPIEERYYWKSLLKNLEYWQKDFWAISEMEFSHSNNEKAFQFGNDANRIGESIIPIAKKAQGGYASQPQNFSLIKYRCRRLGKTDNSELVNNDTIVSISNADGRVIFTNMFRILDSSYFKKPENDRK